MERLGLRFGAGLEAGGAPVVGREREADAECEKAFGGEFGLDVRFDVGFDVVRFGIGLLGPATSGDGRGEVFVCAVGFGGLSEGGGLVLGLRVGGGNGRGVSMGRGCRDAEPF